jgi:hypothetical protein
LPDLGLSRADLAVLKKAYRNALLCSVDEVAGVLKPKQKTFAIAIKCSPVKKKASKK